MSDSRNTLQHPTCSTAWWRYGHVWMVIGGPLVVVVASVITYFIAASTADDLVEKDAVVLSSPTSHAPQAIHPGMLPSLVGRNHAATVKP